MDKYSRSKFKLEECEVSIEVQPTDEKYAIAYLNVRFPDGRWAVFATAKKYVIPLFKKEILEK